MVAQHLNSFIRHADIVKMANITMLSSLVGNSPDGDYKNALYQAFYLYSNNARGTALDVYADSEKYSNKIFNDIPYLDVTAVFNDTAKTLVVNVVNRNEANAITSDIVLQSGEFTGNATVKEVNGESVTATNTKTNEAVSIATKEIQFSGNNIKYSFSGTFIHADADPRQIDQPRSADYESKIQPPIERRHYVKFTF